MTEGLLDKLGDRIRSWSASLWETAENGLGGFRMNDAAGVNLLSSTDVAWTRYAAGDEDVAGDLRDAWVRFLQSRQDPRTGRYEYEPHAGTTLSSGHALWHTVRALNILGGDLLHFPHYLRPVATPDGLERFFDATDWSGKQSNHHEVLGLVPLLANLGDPAWGDVFYRKLARQQDPESGTWPAGRPTNISRTFAYTCLHIATGRLPPMPERIVDAILSLQRPDGLWQGGAGFLTMDSAYLLARLPRAIHHRESDAAASLERLRSAMDGLIETALEDILRNTHGTLAFVQTFSLLQEAFPAAYPSARPWRFDWDQPELYHSDTIRNGLVR